MNHWRSEETYLARPTPQVSSLASLVAVRGTGVRGLRRCLATLPNLPKAYASIFSGIATLYCHIIALSCPSVHPSIYFNRATRPIMGTPVKYIVYYRVYQNKSGDRTLVSILFKIRPIARLHIKTDKWKLSLYPCSTPWVGVSESLQCLGSCLNY